MVFERALGALCRVKLKPYKYMCTVSRHAAHPTMRAHVATMFAFSTVLTCDGSSN